MAPGGPVPTGSGLTRLSKLLEWIHMDITERLDAKTTVMSNGCHEWTGTKTKKGYGQISYKCKKRYTHILTWELVNGDIPDGLYVLHRCDNPPCRNIPCLFLGTSADNTADMMAKGRGNNGNSVKTHCKYNHAFTIENTIIKKDGSRQCRECNKRDCREYKMRRKLTLDRLTRV